MTLDIVSTEQSVDHFGRRVHSDLNANQSCYSSAAKLLRKQRYKRNFLTKIQNSRSVKQFIFQVSAFLTKLKSYSDDDFNANYVLIMTKYYFKGLSPRRT
jgi:hypothetical protein